MSSVRLPTEIEKNPQGPSRSRQIDTIVLVKSIAASKAFYSDTMQLEILHDWESMVVFRNRLAFHQADLLQPQEVMGSLVQTEAIGSPNLIVYIGTDNITEEFNRLAGLGVQVIHGIVDLPWQKIFRVRDCDGYIVEIGEEKVT